MAETFDLVVRGGTVVTPSGPTATDVGVRDGRIVSVGEGTAAAGSHPGSALGLALAREGAVTGKTVTESAIGGGWPVLPAGANTGANKAL